MNEFSLICENEDATTQVAATLAPMLRVGDAIILKGSLAGGKTKFVQSLVAALGSEADVTSPTFTLAHFYPTSAGTFLHVDAYRLSGLPEYRDLGLDDFTDDSITAIEWGDKVHKDFPDSLSIDFEFLPAGETFRKLTFSASAQRWMPVLEQLQRDMCKCLHA
jgi:tRNA threonylcarbamoyladenosine biosynthesis protein TsaE